MAHANSILDTDDIKKQSDKAKVDSKLALVDRLDDYYEDKGLVTGKIKQ